MLEPTLSVVYPPGDPNDFVVTYLTPKKEIKNKKSEKFEYSWERKPAPLKVMTEKIGHLVNRRRLTLYLYTAFSDRVFNRMQVERCYQIFTILLQNATVIDIDDAVYIFYEYHHKNPGVFTDTRIKMVEYLLQYNQINILCFEVNQQENIDYINTSKWSTERKQTDESGKKYLTFKLIELLDNDWAYNHFYNYWNSLPNHEKCRTLLKNLKLPNDIVNYIFEQLTDECQ